MTNTVKEAYGEILRLRNKFYQKWQEVPHEVYDENRNTYKAKYEAFDKALELLTPSIVDPQPEEPMTRGEALIAAILLKFGAEFDKETPEEVALIKEQERKLNRILKIFGI